MDDEREDPFLHYGRRGWMWIEPSDGLGGDPALDDGLGRGDFGDWGYAVEESRAGDGTALAHELREVARYGRPIPPGVLFHLADIIDGAEAFKRRKKLTVLVRERQKRYWREARVVEAVNAEMANRGRKRDKTLRPRLIHEFSAEYGTTPEKVRLYIASGARKNR